jgi:glycosyltransferase involved in cell wall biosynthesis
MACGLPCVAADVSGVRELVEDGVTGFLFEVDDPDSLRNAILRANSVNIVELGEAARGQVEKKFDIRRLGADYQALYSSLATGSVNEPTGGNGR